jgi:hypothetical protein
MFAKSIDGVDTERRNRRIFRFERVGGFSTLIFLALVLQVFVIRPMSILLFGFPTLFDLAKDDRSMTPSITRSLVTFSLLPLNISGSDFSLAFYWVCMEDIGVSWSTSAVRRLCMHHVCVVILRMKRKI